ncbi:phosphosulfolactate synthase [Paenibacillus turpanensis]|uniref:phosphosulfolactate synthase n=1 Tax=Paenibacillus turpanensis TaxID=2689078 RepID=UPI00140B1B08|nr:phosphosulfolactate synthase [Paenibacillus turpanensis]
MEAKPHAEWHPMLQDPTGSRAGKPRTAGKTMVIDKGLGIRAYEDLLETSGAYIDMIKLGFGTSVLYSRKALLEKIAIAKQNGIAIMPGGTFLEVAITKGLVASFFQSVTKLGFTAIEVSDGTIDMNRRLRSELIIRGLDEGLEVYTEYGKKMWGSQIEIEDFLETVHTDISLGAAHVTVEGRESGIGVGIFDENGECKEDEIDLVIKNVPSPDCLMWEAPLKSQQTQLILKLGPDIHLGNIAPEEVIALEALRRGLRSDTMKLGMRTENHNK